MKNLSSLENYSSLNIRYQNRNYPQFLRKIMGFFCEMISDISGVSTCSYVAHAEIPVYLSFPGVVGLGHLRISAGEESSLESVAALHDFAKMVRFSDFLYFLKIDQNRPIFARLVLGHQRRYSGSVFSYDQVTIHSFQKSWCRIISI